MKEIRKKLLEFTEKRNWIRFHKPDYLAKSIIIEASELLENFQWGDSSFDLENVKEEIADILIYTIHLTNSLNLDPIELIEKKLEKNEKRFEVTNKKNTLIELSEKNLEDVKNYRDAFVKNNKLNELHVTSYLERYDDINEWYNNIKMPNGKLVPFTQYLFYVNETLVGMLNIRHYLKGTLETTGGHIGYSINPFYRNYGFATIMLGLALKEAKNLGINRCLITCDINNIFSAKVIEKNNGIFESIIKDNNKIMRRYWIDLERGK